VWTNKTELQTLTMRKGWQSSNGRTPRPLLPPPTEVNVAVVVVQVQVRVQVQGVGDGTGRQMQVWLVVQMQCCTTWQQNQIAPRLMGMGWWIQSGN
jgi:hypothetical protein